MTKKKKDLIQVTQDLNKLREEHFNKTFSRNELEHICSKIGISKIYFDQLTKNGLFNSTRIGHNVLYEFPKAPIYKGVIERAYETIRMKNRKPEEQKVQILNEENAVELLKRLGYRIFKLEGVNIDKLREEEPKIFEKYKLEKEI